jgi:hypothetical protein
MTGEGSFLVATADPGSFVNSVFLDHFGLRMVMAAALRTRRSELPPPGALDSMLKEGKS